MTLQLKSSAFADGARIPDRNARKGDNLSPALEWEGAPENTRSFALICEDPDAPNGTFRHWAAYGIGPDRAALPEDAAGAEGDFKQATNDFGAARYDGPQPPEGHGTHHYHFRLAALDVATLDMPQDAKVEDVWNAARPHILEEAEIIGTYER